MAKPKLCTLGPKHKWEWKLDTTLRTMPRPGVISLARRGVYSCPCGEKKYGAARSGL